MDETTARRTVHVGGLPLDVDEATVQAAFIPFGDIVKITLVKQGPREEGESEAAAAARRQGVAYVEYEDIADTKEALDNMDQAEIYGRVIRVTQAQASQLPAAAARLDTSKPVWEQEYNDPQLK